MEKALGEFWTQHLGTDGAGVWLGAPQSQHTQVCSPPAAEEAGTGRGNQELGRDLGTKPPLCGPDKQRPQHPRETWQVPVPLPSDKQNCHSPSPHCFAVAAHRLYLDIHCVLVKALRTQTHRVLCIFTPVIIHPVISDWSVVFIICYSSVSCLKCFQSRHRKSCPVPKQTHAHTAELTGTKHFPNILVSTQHVETTQPSSAALIFPQRRLCLLW